MIWQKCLPWLLASHPPSPYLCPFSQLVTFCKAKPLLDNMTIAVTEWLHMARRCPQKEKWIMPRGLLLYSPKSLDWCSSYLAKWMTESWSYYNVDIAPYITRPVCIFSSALCQVREEREDILCKMPLGGRPRIFGPRTWVYNGCILSKSGANHQPKCRKKSKPWEYLTPRKGSINICSTPGCSFCIGTLKISSCKIVKLTPLPSWYISGQSNNCQGT